MDFDNVLYIIGNGFDLHHGVMSSYRSFKIWLQRKNPAMHQMLEDVCKVDFLWRDFESALAYVNRDAFLAVGDVWLPQGWTEDDSYSELFFAKDQAMYAAQSMWDDIVKAFRAWVPTIKWQPQYDTNKIRLDDMARFVTFNYTPFLETQYGIPAQNILYIHGVRGSKKYPPIIGHDGRDTYDDWWKKKSYYRKYYKGKQSMLPEVEMMLEGVEEYFSLSEKPVREIIEKNRAFIDDLYDVEHIYVLGHSLGNVDLPYFRAINNAIDYPERICWHVSYYSNEERQKLEGIMRKNVIHQGASLKMTRLEELKMNKN